MKTENYFQVILKNGKTHPKLFRDPAKAMKEVGSGNIKMLREVLACQVTAKYTEIDSLTGTKENEL